MVGGDLPRRLADALTERAAPSCRCLGRPGDLRCCRCVRLADARAVACGAARRTGRDRDRALELARLDAHRISGDSTMNEPSPPGIAQPLARYAAYRRVGDFIYLSGVIAVD